MRGGDKKYQFDRKCYAVSLTLATPQTTRTREKICWQSSKKDHSGDHLLQKAAELKVFLPVVRAFRGVFALL